MKSLVSCVLFLCLSVSAIAGECVLKTTRVACPGKEKESFSKCNGQASCDEKVVADSAKECARKRRSHATTAVLPSPRARRSPPHLMGKPSKVARMFVLPRRSDYNKCEQ